MNKRAWLPVGAAALALSLAVGCSPASQVATVADVAPLVSSSPAPSYDRTADSRATRDYIRLVLTQHTKAVAAERAARAAETARADARARERAAELRAAEAKRAAAHAAKVAHAAAVRRVEVTRVTRASSTRVAASLSAIQAYALRKVGTVQYRCLDYVVSRESHWNPNDQNRHSTAYGLFQFLNSTWRGLGLVKTSNPFRQIDAGIRYMKERYRSPCGAAAYWRTHRYY